MNAKLLLWDSSLIRQLFLSRQFVRCNSSAKNRWLDRQRNDFYTKEAKNQDLRSRAAFKLIELDDRFKFFLKNKSQRVLDLGFAPGAWSQVAFDRTKPDGMVLGVDILPCKPPRGVSSIQANILSRKTHELIRLFFSKHFQINRHDELHEDHGYFQHMLEEYLKNLKQTDEYREIFSSDVELTNSSTSVEKFPIDVIVSDMMANTTGVAIKDHYMSMDLCDAALVVAIDLLRPGGSFACKVYTGKEDRLLEKRMKMVFSKVCRFKPDSSRNESKELYFVGLGKRDKIDKLKVFTH